MFDSNGPEIMTAMIAGYFHDEPNGEKGVFYARVLIRDTSNSVDANRKMPPIK